MSARDLSNPKLTKAKPPSDYAALLIECAWLCWQEARQELQRWMICFLSCSGGTCMGSRVTEYEALATLLLNLILHCRRKELANLRGELFGNTCGHQRHLTLVHIGLSPAEQKHEKTRSTSAFRTDRH